MTEQKLSIPLKIGLLVVTLSYFLFTVHAVFTLQWWGEWDRIGGGAFRNIILIEDVSAGVCLFFRLAASIIALAALIYYFAKSSISKPAVYKILRAILVLEAIYWLGLFSVAYFSVETFVFLLFRHLSVLSILNNLGVSVIPTVLEAVVLPIILLIFAAKLNPNKPLKTPIKWAFISGTILVAVFWLVNSSIWVSLVQSEGLGYLWSVSTQVNGVETFVLHPEHLVSFVLTTVGLLALVIYTAYVAKKAAGADTFQQLPFRSLGVIMLALGVYFLWNYLSWVLFAGAIWNDWYAWFLGHNLDLWMLSLPLLGLPLLFTHETAEKPQPS